MVIEAIAKRRSVREYKPDAVSDEDIKEIIKAAQFAPTAHGNKAVEFIVIRNPEMKEKIFEIVGQDYVKVAPVLIAAVIDLEKSELPVQDLSIAAGYMFLQATALGLGTVWKNLSADWEKEVKKMLGIPQNFRMINLVPVGNSAEKLPDHSDEEFSEKKIHEELWQGIADRREKTSN